MIQESGDWRNDGEKTKCEKAIGELIGVERVECRELRIPFASASFNMSDYAIRTDRLQCEPMKVSLTLNIASLTAVRKIQAIRRTDVDSQKAGIGPIGKPFRRTNEKSMLFS